MAAPNENRHLGKAINEPLEEEDFKKLAEKVWKVEYDAGFIQSWMSVWKATDRRLGQQNQPDHFIQNFAQMYDLFKLIECEFEQSSPGFMVSISRVDRDFHGHVEYGDLWQLLQGRITKLRQLHRPRAGNGADRNPWPNVDMRITELERNAELGVDEKARLFKNAFELVLSIWLMVSIGEGGLIRLGGEIAYDWPPLGAAEGIGLGEDMSNWRPVWKDLARKGHLYRLETRDLNWIDLEGMGIERMNDEALGVEVKKVSGWYLDSAQGYLHVSLRRILGSPDPVGTHTFPDYFNLRELGRMRNFEVRFTDNILQHLRVMKHRDDWFIPTVYIFQHANILQKLSESCPMDGLRKLAKEALMTMALLIPYDESKWFEDVCKRNERSNGEPTIDKAIGIQWKNYPSHRSHQASNYDYWLKRLLILEEEFNVSPSRIRSWWYDARKGRDSTVVLHN